LEILNWGEREGEYVPYVEGKRVTLTYCQSVQKHKNGDRKPSEQSVVK
jgi:hypothetical protein